MIKTIRKALLALLLTAAVCAKAQVGDYRNDLALGFNGGFVMSSVSFVPKVTQTQHPGFTAGLSFKYTCEKYFKTYCSVYAELNYARIGWKESILDVNDKPVINPTTGVAEAYQRDINYIQLPVFAHLAWGKERKGLQFFFQAGPQFGYMLNESTKTNFTIADRNTTDRANQTCAQDTMAVENKFDYGIIGGGGVEIRTGIGHFVAEARYYFGLSDFFNSTKKDYFSRSAHSYITAKLTYLFDITR